MLNAACGNIMGFNIPYKKKEMRELMRKFSLEMVALLDTRVSENKMHTVMNNYLTGWSVLSNYQHCEV